MKNTKHKESHVANTKYGSGDYYGVAKKNPVGRVREVMGVTAINSKKLGKPPKSLA